MSKEKLKTEKPEDIQEEVHDKEEAEQRKKREADEPKELEAHQPPIVNPATPVSERSHGRRFRGPDTDVSPETA